MPSKITINKTYLSVAMVLAIGAGLLFSRAILSIVMGAGFLYVLFDARMGDNSKRLLRLAAVFAVVLLFFYGYVFLLDNNPVLAERFFLGISVISIVWLAAYIAGSSPLVTHLIIFIGMASCIPTLADMFFQKNLAAAYEKGQIAKTLMDGDHQRFSIWISGCLALAWLSFSRSGKKWLVFCIAFLSLFLVALAVRTGWLFLLLISVAALLYIFFKKIKNSSGFWLIIIVAVSIVGAALMIPFVKKKISYVVWEWKQKEEAGKLAASDATRRMVNSEALALVKQHPAGMGISDGPENLKQRVKEKYPQINDLYGWPFNQYLYWWLIAGWIAGSLPLVFLLYLLVRFIIGKMIVTATWFLFILVTCLYESTLEMQYGLFLAVFFTTIFYKWERSEQRASSV